MLQHFSKKWSNIFQKKKSWTNIFSIFFAKKF
jgi:hypothetical protein